jgi:hypothetical protein
MERGARRPLSVETVVSARGAVTSPFPAGMRADDALNFLAAARALVLFALSMTEFGEMAAVFFGDPVLPASHGAQFCLRDPIPATKEADVHKSSGYYSV